MCEHAMEKLTGIAPGPCSLDVEELPEPWPADPAFRRILGFAPAPPPHRHAGEQLCLVAAQTLARRIPATTPTRVHPDRRRHRNAAPAGRTAAAPSAASIGARAAAWRTRSATGHRIDFLAQNLLAKARCEHARRRAPHPRARPSASAASFRRWSASHIRAPTATRRCAAVRWRSASTRPSTARLDRVRRR